MACNPKVKLQLFWTVPLCTDMPYTITKLKHESGSRTQLSDMVMATRLTLVGIPF